MKFEWIMYSDTYEELVESWMDEETRRLSGCEDGWSDFYRYWICEEGIRAGKNFWALLVCESGIASALFVLGKAPDSVYTVMECFTAPQKRRQGIGTAALAELLEHGEEIIGEKIEEALAVIFPDNTASRKMFSRAGFYLDSVHPDGDVLYYRYKRI